MGKASANIYQCIFKIVMNFIPWGVPKTIEGVGSLHQLPKLIKEQGFNKVLVVTSTIINQELHMLDGLYARLKEDGVDCVVYDGVQPNPTDINVCEGAKIFRENGCQAIIAFGGGSPMDCAKGIGAIVAKPNKKRQASFKAYTRFATRFRPYSPFRQHPARVRKRLLPQ